ncbi:MAG: thioredoxin [Candidatus Marinimicrobia bacterium]|nr:thioredoxin [Candidatus Neomarinimicrobiota bacterium]|tara:strand:- start:12408 stop:12737 length:330 start_codon:yes stop_codon:yes gene_type:complete
MSSNTKEFSEDSFKADVLDSGKPVLVDFWAEWCGPCKMLTPTINEIADDFQGKAVIGKLNVDNHPAIASNYGIRSIPSLLFFKDGKVQNQIMGAVSKSDIEQALNDIID